MWIWILNLKLMIILVTDTRTIFRSSCTAQLKTVNMSTCSITHHSLTHACDMLSNWDSFWIIRGLLACDLLPAAESLVRNLLYLVDTFGFVPNGGRQYYTNRSQPPLISAMVLAVWNASNDDSFLSDALPRLIAQHFYWTTGNKAIRICALRQNAHAYIDARDTTRLDVEYHDGAEVFALSRYHAELYDPRPESFRSGGLTKWCHISGCSHRAWLVQCLKVFLFTSCYREDLQLASEAGVSGREAAALFCDVASAAESGWGKGASNQAVYTHGVSTNCRGSH